MERNHEKSVGAKVWQGAKRGGRLGAGSAGLVVAPAAVSGLVATFGTAGTGTAISALSGAALTKATLAWLGGGALATGGLGVAGGAIVLGAVGVAGAYGAKKLYDRQPRTKDLRIKAERR